jgi:esterase
MQLHFRKLGSGPPLIILHGLYGSGDNWYPIGRALSRQFTVYLIDQRNHGLSPHDPVFNYEVMTLDLFEFYSDRSLEKASIIGHSMGGKVAMNFAFQYPAKVEKLIIIDIALRSYLYSPQIADHQKIIEALSSLDIIHVSSRAEIDTQLAHKIPQPPLRQFLLKNLKRKENNGFYWGLNILALQDNMTELLQKVDSGDSPFKGPVLVVSGKNSGYINQVDRIEFSKVFPDPRFEEFNTGHWVHSEQPDTLINLFLEFLSNT